MRNSIFYSFIKPYRFIHALTQNLKFVLIGLILTLVVLPAHALVLDANLFYFTDETESETKTTNDVTAYAFFLGFALDKKGYYLAGWNYASYSTTDKSDTTEEEYSSSQMGPAFVVFFDRDRTWRASFAYNLKTTADYKTTTVTKQEWRGTGMAFDFGYQLHVSESFSIGIRLNYSTTDYDESVEDTTKDDVSYSKTMIYPSLALTFDL